ncbi:hypothetical protein KDA08_05800 [Candidatus Saccharibacteria bacterium]|nr:hypothetical protein [Candidatus Saccharibacteria bacterium]
MTADAISFFNSFAEAIADGSHDLDNDTFKLQLHTSSYTFDATDAVKADLSNEVANGNGYTTGGATLSSVTWAQTSGDAVFDAADVSWTASGGSIVARSAILLNDTHASDALIGYILLDNSPANVTVTDGNTLTIAWHASNGIFRLTS